MRIGVRGSKLALSYADKAIKAIGKGTIEIIQTEGELIPDTPIHVIAFQGIVCNDILYSSKYGIIYFGVHSSKYIPGDVEHTYYNIFAEVACKSHYDVLSSKVFDGFVIVSHCA